MPQRDFDQFIASQSKKFPWVPDDLLLRYAKAYGTNMDQILQHGDSLLGLGVHYGEGVYEKELVYMIKQEMARGLEDILWRRSKLGVHIGEETQQNIANDLPSLFAEVLG